MLRGPHGAAAAQDEDQGRQRRFHDAAQGGQKSLLAAPAPGHLRVRHDVRGDAVQSGGVGARVAAR